MEDKCADIEKRILNNFKRFGDIRKSCDERIEFLYMIDTIKLAVYVISLISILIFDLKPIYSFIIMGGFIGVTIYTAREKNLCYKVRSELMVEALEEAQKLSDELNKL